MRENDVPLVTIILPLYNTEKYISETIKSVLIQTYSNWELIVVDDCSTDQSVSIVENYLSKDQRIKLIVLEVNSGSPAKPRNTGLLYAKGEYIGFLDADDIWCSNKLETQLNYMMKYRFSFTSTDSIHIDEYTNKINTQGTIQRIFKKYKRKKTLCDLIKYRFVINSSVLVERKLISSFDENIDYVAVEDLCMWLELLRNRDIKYGYIDDKLIKYRVLDGSISERSIQYKQDTKANLCISKFILKYSDSDSFRCLYFNITKEFLKSKIQNLINFLMI